MIRYQLSIFFWLKLDNEYDYGGKCLFNRGEKIGIYEQ